MGRQRCVARSDGWDAMHARLASSIYLVEVVAQEDPTCGADVWMMRQDSGVASHVGLGPRIDGVEPVRNKDAHVGGLGGRVSEEQLLGRHRSGRVYHDFLAGRMGVGDEGWHVRKEWSFEDPRFIALCPEMALEGF